MTRLACQRLKVAEALADPGAAADALRHQRHFIDGAGDVAVAQRTRHMREPRVEHEGFRLAEGVDHAMQEAHEERGVEAHRAGGVEQEDQPQRPDLAAAPGEVEQRAAVGDVAVDGAAQIETAAAPAHALAAHQPRAHDAGEPRGQLMRLRDIGGIDDVAQIGARQVLVARGALAFAAAVAGEVALLVAALDMVGHPGLAATRADILERARGLPVGERRAAPAFAPCGRCGPANRRRRSRRIAASRNAWRRTARAAPVAAGPASRPPARSGSPARRGFRPGRP